MPSKGLRVEEEVLFALVRICTTALYTVGAHRASVWKGGGVGSEWLQVFIYLLFY